MLIQNRMYPAELWKVFSFIESPACSYELILKAAVPCAQGFVSLRLETNKLYFFELGPPLPSRNYGEDETGKQRRRRRRNNKNQKQESGLCAGIVVHLK